MMPKEKQEWICQILADEDAKSRVDPLTEEEGKEDFVPCSR
jgi:hypothetical protein